MHLHSTIDCLHVGSGAKAAVVVTSAAPKITARARVRQELGIFDVVHIVSFEIQGFLSQSQIRMRYGRVETVEDRAHFWAEILS